MNLFNLIIIALKLSFLKATFDLNEHHLQYITDNLTNDECKRLLEMLKINADNDDADMNVEYKYFLNKMSKKKHATTTTKIIITISTTTDSHTCFEKLTKWNEKDGNERTFHHLKRQLEMLNRYDVANKLSDQVNKEVVADLKYFFFDRFNLNKHQESKDDDEIKYKEKPLNEIDNQSTLFPSFSGIFDGLTASVMRYLKIAIIICVSVITITVLSTFACVFIMRSKITNK